MPRSPASRFRLTLIAALAGVLASSAAQAQDTPAYAAKLVTPGTITIATTGNAPPVTLTQADGTLGGFDVALCEQIAGDLGLKTNFVRVDFAATIPGLTAGRFDMVCSSTARNPARLASPDLFMSDPTIENFTTLMVRAGDNAITDVNAVKGKKIGVVRGGQEGQLLGDLFGSDIELVTYPGIAEEILDLNNGRIDAVALNYLTAAYTARSNPGITVLQPGYVKENVSPYDLGLIISRNEPELRDAVNGELAKLKGNGGIDALTKTWVTGP